MRAFRGLRAAQGAALASVLLMGCLTAAGPALAKDQWTSYTRPATFKQHVDRNVAITMRDGVVLRGDVARPDEPGRYPTLIVQTPYNKNGVVNIALGGAFEYLVDRG